MQGALMALAEYIHCVLSRDMAKAQARDSGDGYRLLRKRTEATASMGNFESTIPTKAKLLTECAAPTSTEGKPGNLPGWRGF
jgi:methyl coenzyme M reductase subunit C-like uncharacterized protein (methanogenesis marker protein 7)